MVRAIRVAFAGIDPPHVRRRPHAGRLADRRIHLGHAADGPQRDHRRLHPRLRPQHGEFGATIMIAGNIAGQTRTVPLYIYNLLETPEGFNAGWRLVVVSVAVSAIAMYLGERLEPKK